MNLNLAINNRFGSLLERELYFFVSDNGYGDHRLWKVLEIARCGNSYRPIRIDLALDYFANYLSQFFTNSEMFVILQDTSVFDDWLEELQEELGVDPMSEFPTPEHACEIMKIFDADCRNLFCSYIVEVCPSVFEDLTNHPTSKSEILSSQAFANIPSKFKDTLVSVINSPTGDDFIKVISSRESLDASHLLSLVIDSIAWVIYEELFLETNYEDPLDHGEEEEIAVQNELLSALVDFRASLISELGWIDNSEWLLDDSDLD